MGGDGVRTAPEVHIMRVINNILTKVVRHREFLQTRHIQAIQLVVRFLSISSLRPGEFYTFTEPGGHSTESVTTDYIEVYIASVLKHLKMKPLYGGYTVVL